MEYDYKTLREKRLKDVSFLSYFEKRRTNFIFFQLKTLQSAHERELATCQETVKILQQRLTERDETTTQRRKVPIDYYALKAKVC